MEPQLLEVVPVNLTPHPNADTLSLVKIGGYQVVVKTEEWESRSFGIYIPPDSVLPDTEAFKDMTYLGSGRRLKAVRLRGEVSHGMLLPVGDGLIGLDDLIHGRNLVDLGVTHWNPPEPEEDQEIGPKMDIPTYRMDNGRDRKGVLRFGEQMVVTEKIHGMNARYLWLWDDETMSSGRFWVGSHRRWRKPSLHDKWWRALHENGPYLRQMLMENPGMVAYGEVYGDLGKGFGMKYGLGGTGLVRVAIFDLLMPNGEFLSVPRMEDMLATYVVEGVPVVEYGKFSSMEELYPLAEGITSIGGSTDAKEGIVVRNTGGPRAVVKIVGNGYMMRKEAA
jgi:RNA ligase (TIGR02306 family)